MGQDDLKMAGGTQVMVPSNFSSALVLSSTRKSPTALCTTRAREGRSAWREAKTWGEREEQQKTGKG